jgi:uncharacterized protein
METKNLEILTDKNNKLAAMLLWSSGFSSKRPIVLVIHGWTSSMTRYPERVKPLVEMGYLVLLFDLRGHGKSDGELGLLSPHDHFNDCLAAYDYLISQENADLNNISVIGSSYGGYLASLLTAERKVHHLALTVPALYPNTIFDSTKGIKRSNEVMSYRDEYHAAEDDFALKAISEFTGDLLIITAEKDEILSPTVMENYKNAAKVKYTHADVKGADHSMKILGTNEERIRIHAEWFKQFKTK